MTGKDQPAKVFVFGDENALFAIGLFDEFTIDGALRDLVDGQYIEAGRTQNAHDAKVATFVGEETQIAHARSGRLQDDGFVGNGVGRISQRGLDVGARQARVGI